MTLTGQWSLVLVHLRPQLNGDCSLLVQPVTQDHLQSELGPSVRSKGRVAYPELLDARCPKELVSARSSNVIRQYNYGAQSLEAG